MGKYYNPQCTIYVTVIRAGGGGGELLVNENIDYCMHVEVVIRILMTFNVME